jgi:hypothetical protein
MHWLTGLRTSPTFGVTTLVLVLAIPFCSQPAGNGQDNEQLPSFETPSPVPTGDTPIKNAVKITIKAHITDDEITWDEHGDLDTSQTFELSLDRIRADHEFRKCVGDEVVLSIPLTITQVKDPAGAVRLTGDASLYEGTGCNTTDEGAKVPFDVVVKANDFEMVSIPRMISQETWGGDSVEFSEFTVANRAARE